MSTLANKVAVVTGGNSGIGFAVCKRLLDEGAKVVLAGRRPDAVQQSVTQLGDGASAVVADVAQLDDLDRLMDEVRRLHGRIDVLFANAGVVRVAPFEEVEESDFDTVFGVNVKGLYFTVQKALPLLSEGASVVLNSSIVSKSGFKNLSVYAATKAAVRSLGQTLAAELAPKEIRVNVLSPGPIRTPIFDKAGMTDEQLERLKEDVPLGRIGTPEEMADVVLFLASNQSRYITGADLQADGGMTQVYRP